MKRKPGAITFGQIAPILVTIAMLVAVIVLKSRCGAAVGNLFKSIDSSSDAGRP